MTDAINAKSDVLETHELDAVSGGTDKEKTQENRKQAEALKAFQQALQDLP